MLREITHGLVAGGGGGDGSRNVLLSEEYGLWARRMFTALLEEE